MKSIYGTMVLPFIIAFILMLLLFIAVCEGSTDVVWVYVPYG